MPHLMRQSMSAVKFIVIPCISECTEMMDVNDDPDFFFKMGSARHRCRSENIAALTDPDVDIARRIPSVFASEYIILYFSSSRRYVYLCSNIFFCGGGIGDSRCR